MVFGVLLSWAYVVLGPRSMPICPAAFPCGLQGLHGSVGCGNAFGSRAWTCVSVVSFKVRPRERCKSRISLFLDLTSFYERVSHSRLFTLAKQVVTGAVQIYRHARIFVGRSGCVSPCLLPQRHPCWLPYRTSSS